MAFTIYQASAPVFKRGLTNLAAILKKAEGFAEAKKIEPAVLLQARLAPDMHPLTRQVQMVSDSSKGTCARLVGIDPPSMPDTETSFAEVQARIQKTIDFISGLDASKFDGSEAREIVMKFPQGSMTFTGADYLTTFALPNFYFHVTTAYAILRHNGLEIGKMDFLGGR